MKTSKTKRMIWWTDATECLNFTGSWKNGTGDTCSMIIDLIDDLDTQESELTKLRKRVTILEDALKEISTAAPRDDEHETAHTSNYYRLKASFNRANQALAESAKIAGE